MPRKSNKVFLSSHPLNEPRYATTAIGARVIVPWNVSRTHKRKLAKRSGRYLSGSKEKKGELHFYCEYEPGTEATIIRTSAPKALHDVFTPVRGMSTIPANALNTDPYVFGNHFKNICCQIGNRRYIPGDMVIFGNFTDDRQYFSVDTVMIIKGMRVINHALDRTQYYNAGVKPLNFPPEFFYEGENYVSGKPYYSYVPCRLDISNTTMPCLDLSKLGFTVKFWGRKPVVASVPFTKWIWNEVMNEIKKAGWLIGTHIDAI